MIKDLWNKIFFSKVNDSLSIDDKLVEDIKKLSLNESYIINLTRLLEQKGFENINVIAGEFLNLSDNLSDECCIDIFFEKEHLYMFSLFCDGILLLKNENKLEKDKHGHSFEDIDYKDLLKMNIKKSIISIVQIKNAA